MPPTDQAARPPSTPRKAFILYSKKDTGHLRRLETALATLRNQGRIKAWHDRMLLPGTPWDPVLRKHIQEAEIYLMLVSPDFLATDYIRDIELKIAFERHERNEAQIVLVLLRPSDWHATSLSRLTATPTRETARSAALTPITEWRVKDKAWETVISDLRRVLDEFDGNHPAHSQAASASEEPPPPHPDQTPTRENLDTGLRRQRPHHEVREALRTILDRDDGARALASILARPGYLAVPSDLPIIEDVADALIRAGCRASSLREVFSKLNLAAAQLKSDFPQHLLAGLEAACEIVEHLAPVGSQDVATEAGDGEANFGVATAMPASLDIIVAREGGHPSFLERRGDELVGRGRIAEPAFGSQLRRDTDSIAREFIRFVAQELGLDLDVDYPGGLAPEIDARLEDFMARTPEGNPGLEFCPRYIDALVDRADPVLTKDVRRRIRTLLRRLMIITRQRTQSDLDRALTKVTSLYRERDKK